MPPLARLLVVLFLGIGVPAVAAPPEEGAPRSAEIRVLVLEDAWRVGDEKTYTLMFDRAPFGRHAMRLVALRTGPDGEREAEFRQRITLDLRAIGQEGTLEQSGTIVYRAATSGPYRYREALLREEGYATYRSPGDYERSAAVDLDPATGTYRVRPDRGEALAGALPGPAEAVLLDLLALGHWERVFSLRERWPLASAVPAPLVLPTPPPRFDFHLAVAGPRPLDPTRLTASIVVEAVEEIDLLGARARAFRCGLEPLGMTLWVSPNGGILRFADGRGLTGALEP
jgi:hypothetical protein